MNIAHDALFQNCINGSALPNMRTDRATDKKYFPESLTQIQNNFTGLFLMVHSTEISQMVPLH